MTVRQLYCFFFSSRRRHTRFDCDWSSDVCSSDLTISLAASYGNKAAPGSMVSLFGTHLATTSGPASSFPLPTTINGTQVFLNGEARSEERRVGKECRSRWSPYHLKKKKTKKNSTI